MFLHKSPPKLPASKVPPAFYRLRDVMRIAALSRSTIYRRVAEGRFPPPVHLGGRASAWPSAALQEWVDDPEGYKAARLQAQAYAPASSSRLEDFSIEVDRRRSVASATALPAAKSSSRSAQS